MNLIPGRLYKIQNDVYLSNFYGRDKHIKKDSICMLIKVFQPQNAGLFTIIKLEILFNNEIHLIKVFNKNLKYYLEKI